MTLDRLRIYLFGEPRFEFRGEPLRFNAPPKTLPLLAYLLLHRRGPVARETLATLLWPDADQATGYTNLRRHLHYLSKALPEPPNGTPWLLTTKTHLAWNAQSPYWLDVEAFETELAERQLRTHAVRLYSGDLYERCAEEWTDFERERLRTLQISNLAQLAADAQKRSAYVDALQYAQLMLAADPWREDAVRTIMETRMLLGDRAGALAEYERFAARLRDELQTRPLAETAQVYERIAKSHAAAAADTATAAQARAQTLIGRRNELATLRAEWQRASRGEGRAVFIGGEAGIGKTTLLEALSETVSESGGIVFAGAAAPHEESAYAALLEPAHALGIDLVTPVANDDERLRTFESFAAALESRARSKPLMLAVEDVHWAGGATHDLLRFLILRLTNAPVLFALTYREFEVHRGHPLSMLRRQLSKMRRCTVVALSALARDDVRELAFLRAGRRLSDDLVARIFERSDGNPLFVSEIVLELRRGGHERVPESIAEIVRGRLERLSDRARSFLEIAAIAGSGLSTELLVRLSGLREAEVIQLVDELAAAHFLRENALDAVSFVHEVIREAVYAQIPSDRTRAAHARAGFALQRLGGDRYAEVAAAAARHFELGGIAEEAVQAYIAAAEHALDVYANDEASSYAQKALDTASSEHERFRALRVLESASDRRADRAQQRAHLQQLLAFEGKVGDDDFADVLLRYVDFSSGEPADAQRDALQRLEAMLTRVPERKTSYLLRRGEYLSRIGEMRDAIHVLQEALSEMSGRDDPDALLRCLAALYMAAVAVGDERMEGFQHLVNQARVNLEHRADARIGARLAFIESASLIDRDPVAAAQVAERMLEHAHIAGDLWLEALAHRTCGACATRRMLIGQAQAHFRRCSEITIAAGRLRDLARVRSWQVMIENRSGNFAAAERYGGEGLEAARACGASDLVTFMHSNLANTAVWAGDLETAERRLREAIRLSEQLGYSPASISSLLGEVLIGKGDRSGGTAIIESAFAASAPQDDALRTNRVHYPLLLALAYLAAGRDADSRTYAEGIRGELEAFECYYVHPQVYLWSAAQLLRMLGYDDDAQLFADAARRRRLEILETIEDAVTRDTFKRFIFNRLIEEGTQVDNPLHAWFLPYEAKAGAGAPVQ
jgi:DNA-binding SARP family transcriptional activator